MLLLPDEELLRRAATAANGGDFQALWAGDPGKVESRSEADLALCSHLAFWTRGDEAQIDRLFRQSGLYRGKWDREDYRAATIRKAVAGCSNFYEPKPAESGTTYRHNNPLLTKISELHPEKNRRYRWTDVGSARLFADVFKDAARYVPERKKWFVYTGKRWEPDLEALRVMNLATQLADQLLLYCLSIKDDELKANYTEYAGKWQSRAFRERVLKDAAAIHPVALARFDAQRMLFNCLNGTLDLKTRSFHEHRPQDMLSLISGVNYDPEAQIERWERFVLEIMQGDLSKAAFLQKGAWIRAHRRHQL